MNVEHKVGVHIESQGHAVGLHVRRCSRLPEEEMTIGIKRFRLNLNFHAAEARSRRSFLRTSRLHAIHQNIRVMYHPLISWPYFYAFQPAGCLHWSAKNKVPVLVTAAGWQQIRLFRLDDQI